MKKSSCKTSGIVSVMVCFALFSGAFADMQTIINLPANTWYAVPSTHLASSPEASPNYLSASDFNKIRGYSGFAGLMDSWSGGAFDTKNNRLLVTGGGDQDYAGNDIYGFEISTLTWKRLKDPMLNYTDCAQENTDGTPTARHTYGGLAYITSSDKFFMHGGALSCMGRGCGANRSYAFNLTTKTWAYLNPTGARPDGYCGCNCAYDPETNKIYFSDEGYGSSGSGLFTYDVVTNQWTKRTSESFYYYTSTVDTKRGLLVYVGNGNVFSYDIRHAAFTRQNWTTTGGSSFISGTNVGLVYDPASDKIVGWNGGSVYTLNPDTKVWTAYSATGAPTATERGIYGRWQYAPSVNAFVLVTAVDQNVYFYKLTAGAGTGTDQKAIAAPAAGRFSLQVSPNPVNLSSKISFAMSEKANVMVDLVTTAGKIQATIVNGALNAGVHSYSWNADKLPCGVYLVRLKVGSSVSVQKVFLTR